MKAGAPLRLAQREPVLGGFYGTGDAGFVAGAAIASLS